MLGLRELLQRGVPTTPAGRDGFFDIDATFCVPGFWTAYTARARSRGLRTADLELPAKVAGYAHAIGIERALGEGDTFQHARPGAGVTYSPLILLETPEHTERATGEINGCIRSLFPDRDHAVFVSAICELVGDLFDNVWSHGKSTGFSMAQKWRKSRGKGVFFEVAVADCGLGFLRELRRAGVPGIESHEHAIDWCIQRGNSTKSKAVDQWAQRLPVDAMGNPMPGIGRVVETDNHHMGLGLAKLADAVGRFQGWLWLATGGAMLVVRPGQERVYEKIRTEWQGVAIACRFDSERVRQALRDAAADEFAEAFARLVQDRP